MHSVCQQLYPGAVSEQPLPVSQRLGRVHSVENHACLLHRDTVQVYEQLRESGLQYGPSFRLLRNIHVPDVSA